MNTNLSIQIINYLLIASEGIFIRANNPKFLEDWAKTAAL